MKILAVVPDRRVFDRIEPFLGRSTLDVERLESGLRALPLISRLPFDLIVVHDPLPDLGIETFLSVLHDPAAASSETPTLVLTRDERLESLERFLDGQRVQACCIDLPGDYLHKALKELIGIALRTRARLMVQTEVRMDEAAVQRICQSVNISETGILLRTARPLPEGTEISFCFELPDGSGEIAGCGTVVRQAVPEVERLRGLALRFRSLDGDGRERLAEFVRSRSI